MLEQILRKKLMTAFSPCTIDIKNFSAAHAHHPQTPGTGESHFHISLISPVFHGLSLIARQRKVYDVLAIELAAGLHALTLDLRTPA